MITKIVYSSNTGHVSYSDSKEGGVKLAPELTIENPNYDPDPETQDPVLRAAFMRTHVTFQADNPRGDSSISIPARPQIIQNICTAVWATRKSGIGDAVLICEKAIIVINKKIVITPDTDLLELTEDIAAFAGAIYYDKTAWAVVRYRALKTIQEN